MAERIDIYRADGTKTGRTQLRGASLAPGDCARYVLGLVRDSSGRYLIAKRAPQKRWGAGWWELPGGAVQAGESGPAALKREIFEETGLATTPPEEPIWRPEIFHACLGDCLIDIYLIEQDIDVCALRLQPEETVAARLATAEEIACLGEAGMFLHYERIEGALVRAGR